MVGGAIAAPFTLGFSLIATAVGGAVCTAGVLTSAGAGIAEFNISKKKVSEIQEAVEEDNKQAVVIQRMWRDIMGACTEVARKHSDTGHTIEDVLSVLLVWCINKIPDKILSKAPIPKSFREKASDPELQKRAQCFDEFVSHTIDITCGFKSGAKVGKCYYRAVVTALAATKGRSSVCDLGIVGSIIRKLVVAVKLFRVGAWINPAIAIGFAALGGATGIISLIIDVYKIHKKSDSDSKAAKELAQVRDQLEESRDQLIKIKECLSDINI